MIDNKFLTSLLLFVKANDEFHRDILLAIVKSFIRLEMNLPKSILDRLEKDKKAILTALFGIDTLWNHTQVCEVYGRRGPLEDCIRHKALITCDEIIKKLDPIILSDKNKLDIENRIRVNYIHYLKIHLRKKFSNLTNTLEKACYIDSNSEVHP